MDATGYTITPGKVYPDLVSSFNALAALDIKSLLKSGYTYIRVVNIPSENLASPFPIQVIGKKYEVPEFLVEVGLNPTFLLKKGGNITHAVINGFLIDLNSDKKTNFKNAMIYR
ncbi:hypothetical protein ACU8V7_26235 [Zobellia nedashkovskayae]